MKKEVITISTISTILKKSAFAMFIISIMTACFIWFFSQNNVNASGDQQFEKNLDYHCFMRFMGQDHDMGIQTFTIRGTAPDEVFSGQEFDISVSVSITYPNNQEPNLLTDATFSVTSENEELTATVGPLDEEVYLPDIVGNPPYILNLTGKDEVSIGSFIAGKEGEVVLKADTISFSFKLAPNRVVVMEAKYNCYPAEGADPVIASIPIAQDNEAPVITLLGDNPMIIKRGDVFEDPGAKAEDNIDGDLSDQITVTGEVDTNTIGTYTLKYTVSDKAGNVSTVERIVKVVEPFGNWYTGEGPPSDELGSNGDSYLDVTTGDVYKRDPNKWTKVGNIKGDDGKQGSKIHTGSGSPKADLGDIGDLYLDTKTGDVYEKTENGWVKVANLQGPVGPSGPKGPKGTDGTGGSGGDGTGTGKKGSGTAKDNGDAKGTTAKGGKLPKTATSLPAFILVGILLVMVGVLFVKRRKEITQE